MKDGHGRAITYLRISVTDRCDLRCRYCMPAEGIRLCRHEDILSFDEIVRVVRIMASLGVRRVRLTGGEPLVRRDLTQLIAALRAVPGIAYIGLTTNGTQLAGQAGALSRAGVDGVNISLDTTDAKRYRALTRTGELDAVLAGIRAALAQPFGHVKLNAVLSPFSTPEDWLGVAALARQQPLDVRLIEWMPMAGEADAHMHAKGTVSAGEALELLERRFGTLTPLCADAGAGPARYWRAPGFRGRLGMIHAMSQCFCQSCNRVRLSAQGDLRLCLFYESGVSLRALLRGGAQDSDIRDAVRRAVDAKPARHAGRVLAAEGSPMLGSGCGMYGIGG